MILPAFLKLPSAGMLQVYYNFGVLEILAFEILALKNRGFC